MIQDDDAFTPVLDAKLSALRDQIGPAAWTERVEEAKLRERIVQDVLRLQREGQTLASALRASGDPMSIDTFKNWLSRYERQGPVGLITRTGLLRTRAIEDPTPRPAGPRRIRKRATSFLKWAGCKQQIVPRIRARVPASFGKYYEPMVGSGAVFLAISPRVAVLGDVNAELTNCYRVVRDRVAELIEALRAHVNTYEHYIATRALEPTDLPEVERAARTIYLNKTCYNGLYRVNRRGRFNVPYGWRGSANFVDAEALLRVHRALQGVELRTGSYDQTVQDACEGDLVYFDPPYAVESWRAHSFHEYQPEAFDEAAHRKLASTFRELSSRGCYVLLSNSNVPLVHELYAGFDIEVVPVIRKVNRNAKERAGWVEVLVGA